MITKHDIMVTSRFFWNEKRGCLKDKVSELATNSTNRNIRGLYKGEN
jgi:hypothetical protein